MANNSGNDSKNTLYCSFCGKSQHEVRKLIAGPTVFICDECVELCMDIIREETKTAGLKAGEGVPKNKPLRKIQVKTLFHPGRPSLHRAAKRRIQTLNPHWQRTWVIHQRILSNLESTCSLMTRAVAQMRKWLHNRGRIRKIKISITAWIYSAALHRQ